MCQHRFRPSQCFVSIKQSDSPCPKQFLVGCSSCRESSTPPLNPRGFYAPWRKRHTPKPLDPHRTTPQGDRTMRRKPGSHVPFEIEVEDKEVEVALLPFNSSSSFSRDELGPHTPNPKSQSFSRGYGSILPTSLTYIVLLTRGCSPWRPDAVMSTTGHERYSVLQIFKGRRGRTRHHKTCGALPAARPYLRVNRFQGGQAVKKKR